MMDVRFKESAVKAIDSIVAMLAESTNYGNHTEALMYVADFLRMDDAVRELIKIDDLHQKSKARYIPRDLQNIRHQISTEIHKVGYARYGELYQKIYNSM